MTTDRSRLAQRIAIALILVAALAAVVAFVVPNALLRSDFIRRRVNRTPDRGWLEYHAASSPWPGTLRVKNLRFRDRDPAAEWAFELQDAEVTYAIGDLLRKRFHVTRLSGRGLVFRARSRLTRAEATRERLSRLPPIAGFPDPPLIGPSPKTPATGREWTLLVDELAVEDVREVWVEGYRCTGESRLTGGFLLRPKHRAEVLPSRLVIRNGTIRSGRDVLAADVRATIDARFDPWNPSEFPGSKVLRFVFGRAEAAARLDDAEVVNHLLGEPAGTRFEKGSGRMDVRASVQKGIIAGTIDYRSRDLALRALDVGMRGRLDGRIALSGIRMETWGGGRLDGGYVKLSDATVFDADGKSRPWWGRVDFARGGFHPRGSALFTTTATARARDAHPLLQIASVDLPEWTKRLLRLDEEVAGRVGMRIGKSRVELRRLAARTGRLRIYGEYVARGESKDGTFLFDAGLLSAGIGIAGRERRVRIFGPRRWFRERTGWEPD